MNKRRAGWRSDANRLGRHGCLAFAAIATALSARVCLADVQIGETVEKLLSRKGSPTRTIETDRGSLLFFGATLVEIYQGHVVYVRAGGRKGAADEPRKPAPARPAAVQVAPPEAVLSPADRQWARSIVADVKRVLLFESYRLVLGVDAWPGLAYGCAAFRQDGEGAIASAAAAVRFGQVRGISFLGIKDSDGNRVRVEGEGPSLTCAGFASPQDGDRPLLHMRE